MKRPLVSLTAALAAFQTACAPMGPDYRRPDVETPSHFKESSTWKIARPADHLPRGSWWTVFGDSTLNRLQHQAAGENPNLRAALLRVEQARLVARGSRDELLPNASLIPSAERRGDSGNLRRSNFDDFDFGGTRNTFRLPLDASYEIDFWGRVRRSIEAADADAQAQAALAETARLTLQADLAQNYFALRSVQAEIDILRATVELRRRALKVITDRFQGGATSELDKSRTETEVAGAESDLAELERRRLLLVNAIAVLAGRPASTFDLTVRPLSGVPPSVPSGVPADLLQRRPDIAEAERRMAAANARIGVAKAAFYPSVRLFGRLALESSDTSDLFTKGSKAWALGPAVNFPLLDQAALRADYERQRLQYEETIASYQSTVLAAFQEVENSLGGLRKLAEQAAAQERAVASAERTAKISADRYSAGAVLFLDVVDADRTRLQSQRTAQQITGLRFLTTVQLIKALGGGW
jgi:multidrug efflux system outer membrane protein